MLNHEQLLALHRSLRDERVLSIYVDGSIPDPAVQRSWRVQLDHQLDAMRERLEQRSREERAEFDRCVELANSTLAAFDGAINSPGWAGFITADGVRDAQSLPVHAPTLAIWRTGPFLAPYVRAMKEERPVVVGLADARKATIYVYRLGRLVRIETVRSHHGGEHPEHMGGPGRPGFHTGTRGETGRDSAQRAFLNGRDRMLADAADRIVALAGGDAWIVLGGIKRVTARLAEDLGVHAQPRVLELESLDVHATDAEIAEAARTGASTLRESFDARRIDQIGDENAAHGLGALGPDQTRKALSQACVRELYFTQRYAAEHPDEAEDAVRAALDQDAQVEEVGGSAADRLNGRGGIAAALRFRPAEGSTAAA